jgi:hypothetical protein
MPKTNVEQQFVIDLPNRADRVCAMLVRESPTNFAKDAGSVQYRVRLVRLSTARGVLGLIRRGTLGRFVASL